MHTACSGSAPAPGGLPAAAAPLGRAPRSPPGPRERWTGPPVGRCSPLQCVALCWQRAEPQPAGTSRAPPPPSATPSRAVALLPRERCRRWTTLQAASRCLAACAAATSSLLHPKIPAQARTETTRGKRCKNKPRFQTQITPSNLRGSEPNLNRRCAITRSNRSKKDFVKRWRIAPESKIARKKATKIAKKGKRQGQEEDQFINHSDL